MSAGCGRQARLAPCRKLLGCHIPSTPGDTESPCNPPNSCGDHISSTGAGAGMRTHRLSGAASGAGLPPGPGPPHKASWAPAPA